MNSSFSEVCANRRSDYRDSISRSAKYIGASGEPQRTEVINVSLRGARLTTGPEVRTGDCIQLVCSIANVASIGKRAVVRWTELLPGGHRQMVGVQTL